MTNVEKMEILSEISSILDNYLASADRERGKPETQIQMQMLSINECRDLIKGLSRHTLRELIERGDVKSVRAGVGKNGKILVSKTSLLAYFGKPEETEV